MGKERLASNQSILLFIFLFFCAGGASAQQWIWGWQGKGNRFWEISVASDKQGNAYTTGTFGDTAVFGSYKLSTPPGTACTYIAKYDTSGNVIWAKQASMPTSYNNGNAISIDNTGNSYVLGYFEDTVVFGSFTLIAPKGGFDMFLVKCDPNGNPIWAHQSNSPSAASQASGSSLYTDKHGNIYVTGGFTDTVTFGSMSLYGSDFYIVKYNANGNVIWAKQSKGIGRVNSITIDNLEYLYITGEYNDSITLGSITQYSIGANVFLAKYDTNGNVIWLRHSNAITTTSGGTGYSVVTDCGGNPYVAGVFSDTISFGSVNLISTKNNPDAFLVKYDESGNVIWAKQSIENGTCYAQSLATDEYSHVFLSGIGWLDTLRFGSYILPAKLSSGSTFLVEFDTSGNAQCGSIFDSPDQTIYYKCNVASSSTGSFVYLAGTMINDSVECGKDTLLALNGPYLARWEPCDIKVPPQEYAHNDCDSAFIPNAFTPNGDGLNDVFSPKGKCIVEYSMYIFNRWGSLIYNSNNKPWDGTINGNLVQEDTYVYKMNIITGDSEEKDYIGRITVLR
ncbi:MAG TPA: T9SS type B sorting domain-containing protein [Bacteroidia bacterium]|nr:T9SS type B sorting domain-containing protein [Bacteroidia bacterium]